MASAGSKDSLDRRDFLTRACIAGTAVGLAGMPTESVGAKHGAVSVMNLRREHFEKLIGQQFMVVAGPNGNVGLKLVQVRETAGHDSGRPLHIRQKAFSLLLVGSCRDKLPPETYQIRNPALGAYDLFLHEVGPNGNSNTAWYEAVFN